MKKVTIKRSTLSPYLGDTLAGCAIAFLALVWLALVIVCAAAPWVLVLLVAHWLGAF
jgi:uncharacterized protein (DUF58 family)